MRMTIPSSSSSLSQMEVKRVLVAVAAAAAVDVVVDVDVDVPKKLLLVLSNIQFRRRQGCTTQKHRRYLSCAQTIYSQQQKTDTERVWQKK